MANTYTLISSVTVGSGGAANIEFTSIPATYTDLVIKGSARCNFAGETDRYMDVTFNNSGGTAYSTRELLASGSSVSSLNWSSMAQFYGFIQAAVTATANTFSNFEFYIPNYAGSNYKSISNDGVSETNASAGTNRLLSLSASLWANTAAITSIKIASPSSSFIQYSNFYLYGISNA